MNTKTKTNTRTNRSSRNKFDFSDVGISRQSKSPHYWCHKPILFLSVLVFSLNVLPCALAEKQTSIAADNATTVPPTNSFENDHKTDAQDITTLPPGVLDSSGNITGLNLPGRSAHLVQPVAKAQQNELPKPKGFDAALSLYNAHKYSLAQKEFEKMVSEGIADVKTHSYLAYSYYYQRMYSKAVKEFDWVSRNASLISEKRSAEATMHALQALRSGICPATCLKASDPGWHKLAGHDGLWMTLPGGHSLSENHIGDLLVLEHGEMVDKGQCPTCGGSGHVDILKDGDPLPR